MSSTRTSRCVAVDDECLHTQTAAWDDASSLPALYSAVRLISVVKDLISTNSALRTEIGKRLQTSLKTARDVLLNAPARPPTAPTRLLLDLLIATTRGQSLDGLKLDEVLPKVRDCSPLS